jgi:hypothetical protein
MNRIRSALSLAFLALTAAPGPSPPGTSLCESAELAIWSCSTTRRSYSVCASSDLDSSSGYMQYRAGTRSAIEFRYPETLRHPRGVFVFSILGNGASLSFENGGFQYLIHEPLLSGATITVSRAGRERATVRCATSTETLTLTTTINQLRAVGIVE